MGRWLVVLLLMIGVARLIVPASFAKSCFEQCDDDSDEGDCAPGCDDCSCCARVSLVTPTLPTSPTILLAPELRSFEHDALPPSADDRELLDVPKAS